MDGIASVFIWIGVAIVGLIVLLWFFPITMWFQALISGVRISLLQLILMRWRKVPPGTIVMAMITGTKAGLTLNANELEAHYLAKGNVPKVVNALVSADKANIALNFKMAAAIDLAGRDVFEAVQMSVNPKVINTPPVTAVAKDGIQLIVKARVTVRANIKQLVGGAGEETVLARVGEGIVSSIGSSESHKEVLENPDSISKVVLNKGLDAGTAFEILSIDIADIDIGKNIGAVLKIDQANADKNIAQARAEEKRAMAVAVEQEMKAKAQEARAKVIEQRHKYLSQWPKHSEAAISALWITTNSRISKPTPKCVKVFQKEANSPWISVLKEALVDTRHEGLFYIPLVTQYPELGTALQPVPRNSHRLLAGAFFFLPLEKYNYDGPLYKETVFASLCTCRFPACFCTFISSKPFKGHSGMVST
jgi:uncharacterized protein YqfA (UPF0365 family)